METKPNFFINNEDAFINSAYLSELWAVEDLTKFKNNFPQHWSSYFENRLKDEMRHTAMLKELLHQHSQYRVESCDYAMQEVLYKDQVNLAESQSLNDMLNVHEMMERRALWIYKTYLKIGENIKYKAVVQKILDDEKNHLNCPELPGVLTSAQYQLSKLLEIDKFIFRKMLLPKYGSQIFMSQDFWKNYYKKNV